MSASDSDTRVPDRAYRSGASTDRGISFFHPITMTLDLLIVLSGLCYLFLGIALMMLSLWLFEAWTHFDVRHEILQVQNKALAQIVKGVMMAQGIIITAAIFFTGYTPDHDTPILQVFVPSLVWSSIFGLFGMMFLQ